MVVALTKLPSIRTPLSKTGAWLVPVSKVLRLGCVLTACRNPGCPCTELTIAAYSFDERALDFGVEKGAIVYRRLKLDDQPAPLGEPLVLRLDVQTGELLPYEGEELNLEDRRVAAIADALDAETLDALEGLWRRQKGIPSHAGQLKAQIDAWEPGDLVYWDEIFEIDRQEVFLDSGHHVAASDMYCVNPSCNCRKVTLSFDQGTPPGEVPAPSPIGRVSVSLDADEVSFEPASPSAEPRLRALWARYRRRHPGLRPLAERYHEIRELAPKLAVSRASSPPPSALWPALPSASPDHPFAAATLTLPSPPRAGTAAQAWVSTSRKRTKARR